MFGYFIPNDYCKPKRTVYIWHYSIIFTFIAYAILSVIDAWQGLSISYYGCLLRFLSALTVVTTLFYKISVGKAAVVREKNRRKIRKAKNTISFNERIYTKPLYVELIITFFAAVIPLVLFKFTELNFLVQIYKVVICGQAMVSCIISCANNCAEFYKAKDISYT